MSRTTEVQLQRARRLLAHEGALAGGPDDAAAAAARVFDKIHAQLAPLLGAAGVRALFVRSAHLSHADLSCIDEVACLDDSAQLRACLRALDPVAAASTAEGLFGAFLALIATLIGERLTFQVLRRAWPTLQDATTSEGGR